MKPKVQKGGKITSSKRKMQDTEGMADTEGEGAYKRPNLELDCQQVNETLTNLSDLIKKMDRKQDRMENALEEGFKKSKEDFELRITSSEKKVQSMIDNLKEEQVEINAENSKKFECLDCQVSKLWDHVKLNNRESESFRKDLRNQNHEAEKRLILKGLSPNATDQQVKDILAILECTQYENIKLVKSRNKKAKGLGVVTFKDNGERNKVLFRPGNLKKKILAGITLARDMPEIYRKKYIEFTTHARSMRQVSKGKTMDRIFFNDIELRYIIRDKSNNSQKMGSFIPDSTCPGLDWENTNPIKQLEPGADELRTILMNGLPENTSDGALLDDIGKLISTDVTQITSVTVDKKSVLVLCSTPEAASKIFRVLSVQKSGASTTNVFLAGHKDGKTLMSTIRR